MASPRLHLDADASIRALHSTLTERGHDVTQTPNEWITADASDETQLLTATAHERCIFAIDIRDFVVLAQHHARHGGIILVAQASWSLPGLIVALDRHLPETEAEDSISMVRWRNDWR